MSKSNDKKNAREFIIVQKPNGLDKSVMNHGATYRQNPEYEYIKVREVVPGSVTITREEFGRRIYPLIKDVVLMKDIEEELFGYEE